MNTDETPKKTTLLAQCPFCQGVSKVTVIAEDYETYKKGGYVQDVFPYLSPSERELIKTGICEACFPF